MADLQGRGGITNLAFLCKDEFKIPLNIKQLNSIYTEYVRYNESPLKRISHYSGRSKKSDVCNQLCRITFILNRTHN